MSTYQLDAACVDVIKATLAKPFWTAKNVLFSVVREVPGLSAMPGNSISPTEYGVVKGQLAEET